MSKLEVLPINNYVDRLSKMAPPNDRNLRRFGIQAVDLLIPDGVPNLCALLIAADPGSGSDFLREAVVREHLMRSREAKVLWLSLSRSVDELRNMLASLWMTEDDWLRQVQFIDCYSSQIAINSKERYSADPSNLPQLGVVTSTAISEIGVDSNLLVILDDLTSLVQKVGVRCSTEFFKTLVGRTRCIRAGLLTTLNRRRFRETTLSTFAGIADIVLELALQEGVSDSRLRVRKASNVKHVKTWCPYEIDFDARTLRCNVVEAISNEAERPPERLIKFVPRQFTATSITKERSSPSCHRVGQFCSVGGRAIAERERVAVMIETLSAVGGSYYNSIKILLDNLYLAKSRMGPIDAVRIDNLVRSFCEQTERMNRYFSLPRNHNYINPILRKSKIEKTIQAAIEDVVIPSSVKVQVECGTENAMIDSPMIIRSLTGVIDAAICEMPTGGLLSIRDSVNENMLEIVIANTGVGQWGGNMNKIFDSESSVDASVSLGLIIAKRFIEAHKGQLQIRSEKGKGSLFTIRLPTDSS